MKNLPVEVSDEDVEEMWSYADKNGDGRLSYKEFKVTSVLHDGVTPVIFIIKFNDRL